MPNYDYRCAACGHRFEVVHAVHAPGPGSCQACGSAEVRKAIAAPAIHFKGSGWAKKERASSTSGKAESRGETKEAGDTPASPTPATTPATTAASAAATTSGTAD